MNIEEYETDPQPRFMDGFVWGVIAGASVAALYVILFWRFA